MNKWAATARGVTLVEIIVASFLLVLIGLVCWALFKSSIDASSTGYSNIKIQENARKAMRTMESELRQAMPPLKIGNIDPYPSGVLYPCRDNADTGISNRFIFLEIYGLDGFSQTYSSNLQNYRAVEYRVLAGDSTRNYRLVRRVWEDVLDATTSTSIKGLVWNPGPVFSFNIAPYDATAGFTEDTLLELPFQNDRMYLCMSHPETRQGSMLYDYKIFRINFTLEQTIRNDPRRVKSFYVPTMVKVP